VTDNSCLCISPSGLTAGQKKLSLNERLSLIGLIDEGMRSGSSKAPVVADLFNDLWDLVSATVSGSKIDRLKPEDTKNGFQVFEINAETGENIGRLNMLYLRKPIPCYYLVYVEIASPFRRNDQGNRILRHFRDFLTKKSAMGILDNIIPKEEPTYDIYLKQGWKPIEAIIGDIISDANDNYMIYVSPGLKGKHLREHLLKLLYHLKRKRTTIDMRDNEVMVQRTIAEFKDLYAALLTYFDNEIQRGEEPPVMLFMFTRFVTKLIAFRLRIGDLLGYTGGQSMEQIVLDHEIAALPIQSYAPRQLVSKSSFVVGDEGLIFRLPKALKEHPAGFIESLSNYRRPSLVAWMMERGITSNDTLTIGDLMDLGFDPTRLKEITIGGEEFIFERVQARTLPELRKRKELLERIASEMQGIKVKNAWLKANPPLVAIRDRGNAYVLRRKVSGIHWEEAVEQLQSSQALKNVNASLKLDRIILETVRKADEMIVDQLGLGKETLLDQLACFVSWNLRINQPKLVIDFPGAFLESVWMA